MSAMENKDVRKALVGNIHLVKEINGYSAFDLAVAHGFKGTEQEWIDSLSAYGVAVKNGFKGTEKEWLASLKGDKGDIGNVEFHGDMDAENTRIINVAAPISDGDATNKKYVDDIGKAVKEYVDNENVASEGYVNENFVPLAYDDITNNYILTTENQNTLPNVTKKSVLKQGREIRGFVELDVSEGLNSGILFYVNRDYLPENAVIVNAVFFNAEDLPVADYLPVLFRYYSVTPNQFVFMNIDKFPSGATKLLLNFSYICK